MTLGGLKSKFMVLPRGMGCGMAKSVPSKEIEFHPDAMQRFERAVSVASKSPQQYRIAKKIKIAIKTKRKTATRIKQSTIK